MEIAGVVAGLLGGLAAVALIDVSCSERTGCQRFPKTDPLGFREI